MSDMAGGRSLISALGRPALLPLRQKLTVRHSYSHHARPGSYTVPTRPISLGYSLHSSGSRSGSKIGRGDVAAFSQSGRLSTHCLMLLQAIEYG